MSIYDPLPTNTIWGTASSTTTTTTNDPYHNGLQQWIGGAGGGVGGPGGVSHGGGGGLGQIIGPGYGGQNRFWPTPGRDFTHKTYYSGIMEMVIALAAEEGADARLFCEVAGTEETGPAEFAEVSVCLARDSESVHLDFGTLCELAGLGNIEGLAQLIQVTVGMLPRAMPTSTEQAKLEALGQLMTSQVAQSLQNTMQSTYARTLMVGLMGDAGTNTVVSYQGDVAKSMEKQSGISKLKEMLRLKK